MKRTNQNKYQVSDQFFWGYMLLCFVIICLTCVGCHPVQAFNDWMGYEDDHFCEEVVEMAIEHQFDYDVDLSPRSPE